MTLPKRKAARLLDEAKARLAAGDPASVERVTAQLLAESNLPPGPVLALRAEGLLAAGEDGVALYRDSLKAHPEDPHLSLGLANALARRGEYQAAVPLFAKASATFKKDAAFLMNQGHSLLHAGRVREGRDVFARAVSAGGGPRARLFLANALARLEEWDAAEEVCQKLEQTELKFAAADVRAECRLFRGDAAGALALWKGLREAGRLPPEHVSHMACAAQLSSEPSLAKALMVERLKESPTPEDLLLAAEIAVLRGEKDAASQYLEQASKAEGARYPDFEADLLAIQLRVSGADRGAQPQEKTQASDEGLLRRFHAREKEVEGLRREIERLKVARDNSERQAEIALRDAKDQAQIEAQAAAKRAAQEELQARESDADAKAQENVERALGPVRTSCPPAIFKAVFVAERTYQQALYMELPAAAVAVLYAGALERTLFILFVERFQAWLGEHGRLQPFLRGAVRERRGTRVDYLDNFVEAFDEERPGRAPSMGEVGRVIERQREPYLRPFREFLTERYGFDDAFCDELARFILWSKTQLRDPVAHGRAIDLGYEGLRRFREQLLFQFAQTGQGLLASLLVRG